MNTNTMWDDVNKHLGLAHDITTDLQEVFKKSPRSELKLQLMHHTQIGHHLTDAAMGALSILTHELCQLTRVALWADGITSEYPHIRHPSITVLGGRWKQTRVNPQNGTPAILFDNWYSNAIDRLQITKLAPTSCAENIDNHITKINTWVIANQECTELLRRIIR